MKLHETEGFSFQTKLLLFVFDSNRFWQKHTQTPPPHTRTNIRTHVNVRARIHTQTCARTNIHMHRHKHTRTHTYWSKIKLLHLEYVYEYVESKVCHLCPNSVLIYCISSSGMGTDLDSHMHTIVQMVNTILWFIIPCLLHLMMEYNRSWRWATWMSQVLSHHVLYFFEAGLAVLAIVVGVSNILNGILGNTGIMQLPECEECYSPLPEFQQNCLKNVFDAPTLQA